MTSTLGGVSCARPAAGINTPARVTEQRIESALQAGSIAEARDIALQYERRIPGPESWALVGRALWRLGELARAEEFLRRAAGDGHPEGLLGMARVLAARGDYAAALRLATPTVQVEAMAERAARVVAGLYWRSGDAEAAAATFAVAAAAASGENAARLSALAAAVGEVASAGDPIAWTGTAREAGSELVDGVTWVQVEIGDTPARLRFDPTRWRSSVTPQFAARLGAGIADRELARPMSVAGLSSAMVPLAVLEAEPGDGVMGFDLLLDLRWLWTPASGRVFIGAGGNRGEEREFQGELASTHWVGVRTVVDGLAVQLLLVPRIGPRPEVASMARDGIATISPGASMRLGGGVVPGEELRALTRIGGWQAEFDYRVVPETGSLGQVPLPTPVTLGLEFVRHWSWRWSPGSRQMALIELPTADYASN